MAVLTRTLETPRGMLCRGTLFAGRYEVIEVLGVGGMGEVYRVEDKKVGQEIALKLIRPEIAADGKTIERFRHELKTARMISHRNVCRMFDLGEENGTHFITMEYVAGEDLRSFLRRSKQLALGTVLSFAGQVCEGLAEAHRLGVVHRDLKPGNIMIDKEGNARIMDFGIARSPQGKGMTGEGAMIGTPEYMSPEQVEGKEIDPRSDIYALGVILYEMTTGRVPFEGDTPFVVGIKHKSELPRDPREINSQVPEDLSRIILLCLEKDEEKRFQSAALVHTELEKCERGISRAERIIPAKKLQVSRDRARPSRSKKRVVALLMTVALVSIGVVLRRVLPNKPVSEAIGKPSIAVLPFEDLSPQKDQAYFCDGLAESLINALAQVKGLRIPARMSSFSFKGKDLDIEEMGRRLNVRTMLKGSVQKAEDKLRITAQLIDTSDGSLIWSEQYNRRLEDVFFIQDNIAVTIMNKLELDLLKGEKEKLLKRYTRDSEAYDLYLKGRYLVEKRTKEAMEEGIEHFNKAIEIDPKFALAYTGLTDAYVNLAWFGYLPTTDAYARARTQATKALEIDGTLSEAHAAMADIKYGFDWDWAGAEREYQRAIALNSSNAEAHHQYAHFLASVGKLDQSLEEMRLAAELEPLSVVIRSCLGMKLYLSRKYDEAIEELDKVMTTNPEFYDPYGWLGMIYLQKKQFAPSMDMFKKGMNFPAAKTRNMCALGYAYAVTGRKAEAQDQLRRVMAISGEGYVDPCFIAWIYSGLGEKESAFQWLDKAYEERSGWIAYLKVDPFFDPLRSDERFRKLLQKIGLAS
jgi:serine/threonine protein kinase/Tfp pilus assembly protein PilF